MAQSISVAIIATLSALRRLVDRVQADETRAGPYGDDIALYGLPDELERLRVWAANIGAHQKDQSSLDYRLRDSSHIRDEITALLQSLQLSVQEIESVLTEEDPIIQKNTEEFNELYELYKEVVNNVNSLYQMSMMIRRPVRHDQFLALGKFDKSSYEIYDIRHVQDKFSRCSDKIAVRFDRAIIRRRRYMDYKKHHHQKLASGLNEVEQCVVERVLSQTVATEFKMNCLEKTSSNYALSQTSYATSLWKSEDVIKVSPILKQNSDGAVFECPYCFYMITVTGSHSWTRHVFRDFQPYICIIEDCATPDRLYESRHEWFGHMQNIHAFGKSSSTTTCSLCAVPFISAGQFERHIARHLQELALFVLLIEDTDEEEVLNEEFEVCRDGKTSEGKRSSSDSAAYSVVDNAKAIEEAIERLTPFESDSKPDPPTEYTSPHDKFSEFSASSILHMQKDIPSNARWTKIDRELVNPEALAAGNEQFEERPDYVIVLRVLTKEDVEAYALKTQEIRTKRGIPAMTKTDEARAETDEARAKTDEARAETDEARAETDEARAETDEAKAKTDEAKAKTDETRAETNEVQREYKRKKPLSRQRPQYWYSRPKFEDKSKAK